MVNNKLHKLLKLNKLNSNTILNNDDVEYLYSICGKSVYKRFPISGKYIKAIRFNANDLQNNMINIVSKINNFIVKQDLTNVYYEIYSDSINISAYIMQSNEALINFYIKYMLKEDNQIYIGRVKSKSAAVKQIKNLKDKFKIKE